MGFSTYYKFSRGWFFNYILSPRAGIKWRGGSFGKLASSQDYSTIRFSMPKIHERFSGNNFANTKATAKY